MRQLRGHSHARPRAVVPSSRNLDNDAVMLMNAPLVIRRCEPGDEAATLNVLEAVAHANPMYPFRIARERDALDAWLHQADDAERFVAELDGHVIGHAQIAPPSPYIRAVCNELDADVDVANLIEIGRLFVEPNRSRMGVGRALLHHVTDAARARARDCALVLLVPEQQESAVRMYEAAGWVTMFAPNLDVRRAQLPVRIMRAPLVTDPLQ